MLLSPGLPLRGGGNPKFQVYPGGPTYPAPRTSASKTRKQAEIDSKCFHWLSKLTRPLCLVKTNPRISGKCSCTAPLALGKLSEVLSLKRSRVSCEGLWYFRVYVLSEPVEAQSLKRVQAKQIHDLEEEETAVSHSHSWVHESPSINLRFPLSFFPLSPSGPSSPIPKALWNVYDVCPYRCCKQDTRHMFVFLLFWIYIHDTGR